MVAQLRGRDTQEGSDMHLTVHVSCQWLKGLQAASAVVLRLFRCSQLQLLHLRSDTLSRLTIHSIGAATERLLQGIEGMPEKG